MAWAEMRAVERVFYNVAVMREVGSYLNLEDTLSFLESKVGRFEEVMIGRKRKEELLVHLMASLARGGWGGQMPLNGSETFDSCQREISNYMKIVSSLGGNGEEELGQLYDKLVQVFPVPRSSGLKDFNSVNKVEQLSRCSGENWGSIRTILGGVFTCMSTSTFVIAKLAESAMGKLQPRNIGLGGSMEHGDGNLGGKSCYVMGGCLNESIIEGMLSHMEIGKASFRRLEISGVHLDSPASISKFGTLLSKTVDLRIGDGGGNIGHLRVSNELSKTDWAELLKILSTNAHISFGHLETTSGNLMRAGGLIDQLWNHFSNSILIMPQDPLNIWDVKRFQKSQLNFLNEWNYSKLVEFLIFGKNFPTY